MGEFAAFSKQLNKNPNSGARGGGAGFGPEFGVFVRFFLAEMSEKTIQPKMFRIQKFSPIFFWQKSNLVEKCFGRKKNDRKFFGRKFSIRLSVRSSNKSSTYGFLSSSLISYCHGHPLAWHKSCFVGIVMSTVFLTDGCRLV